MGAWMRWVLQMNYDDAETHLKSSYRAMAKCLMELRHYGIDDNVANDLIDLEFMAWAMLDRIQTTRSK